MPTAKIPMKIFSRSILFAIAALSASITCAQTALPLNATIQTSDSSYQVTSTFSNVATFNFNIRLDMPLANGEYIDPPIVNITYQVMGDLVAGTPSGFPAFDLQRTMTGTEFYAQGSSLIFEISPTAVLSDGVQVAELVGNDVVFTFDGREIDNGRFHPALLELRADGTGRLQNSNNIPTLNPLNQVAFGEEYITDLMFDPGNTTLFLPSTQVEPGGESGGSLSVLMLLLLLFILAAREFHRERARLVLQKIRQYTGITVNRRR